VGIPGKRFVYSLDELEKHGATKGERRDGFRDLNFFDKALLAKKM
jgi:hypothetical protein